MPIHKIKARQILNSIGDPTIEIDLITEVGLFRTSVPTVLKPNFSLEGSTIKDIDDLRSVVIEAVETINSQYAPEILKSKLDVDEQLEIDCLLETLAAEHEFNATLGISIAVCKAAAFKKGLPPYRYIANLCDNKCITLPVPVVKFMTSGSDPNTGFKHLSIMPIGATTFAESLTICMDIKKKLEFMIEEDCLPIRISDAGEFITEFDDNNEAILTLQQVIENAECTGKVVVAIDMDASNFYNIETGGYDLQDSTDPEESFNALMDEYVKILEECKSIVSYEDPFYVEDWDSWSELTSRFPDLQVVANNLTAMNISRIDKAIENKAANCLQVNLSQSITLTQALNCIRTARSSGWNCLVSTGQGETEDFFVADFAIGTSAGQFKAGSYCGSVGASKYNQILRIEEELGKDAKYAGSNYKNPLTD